jgi:hypothetical protein
MGLELQVVESATHDEEENDDEDDDQEEKEETDQPNSKRKAEEDANATRNVRQKLDSDSAKAELPYCYVGSYFIVQLLRVELIRRTIAWIDDEMKRTGKNEGDLSSAKALLSTWVKPPPANPLSMAMADIAAGAAASKPVYEEIARISDADIDVLLNVGLLGVYTWTNHSDCDGKWSHFQCVIIDHWLTRIDSKLHDVSAHKWPFTALRTVFRAAADVETRYVECF